MKYRNPALRIARASRTATPTRVERRIPPAGTADVIAGAPAAGTIARSRDGEWTDTGHLGLLADALGQLGERARFVGSLHQPPQAMPAVRATRQCLAMTQRADETSPCREHLRALWGRVMVGQQECRHAVQTDIRRRR